jgi:hypothetical protein
VFVRAVVVLYSAIIIIIHHHQSRQMGKWPSRPEVVEVSAFLGLPISPSASEPLLGVVDTVLALDLYYVDRPPVLMGVPSPVRCGPPPGWRRSYSPNKPSSHQSEWPVVYVACLRALCVRVVHGIIVCVCVTFIRGRRKST